MSRVISLILGEYFDQLIEAQGKSGRYEQQVRLCEMRYGCLNKTNCDTKTERFNRSRLRKWF